MQTSSHTTLLGTATNGEFSILSNKLYFVYFSLCYFAGFNILVQLTLLVFVFIQSQVSFQLATTIIQQCQYGT